MGMKVKYYLKEVAVMHIVIIIKNSNFFRSDLKN